MENLATKMNKKHNQVRRLMLDCSDKIVRESEYLKPLFSKIYTSDIAYIKQQFECVEKCLYERIADIKAYLDVYEQLRNGEVNE